MPETPEGLREVGLTNHPNWWRTVTAMGFTAQKKMPSTRPPQAPGPSFSGYHHGFPGMASHGAQYAMLPHMGLASTFGPYGPPMGVFGLGGKEMMGWVSKMKKEEKEREAQASKREGKGKTGSVGKADASIIITSAVPSKHEGELEREFREADELYEEKAQTSQAKADKLVDV